MKSLDMVLECVSLLPQHWVPLGDLITRQMHTAGASVEGPHVRSGFEIEPRGKLTMGVGSPFWKLHSLSGWHKFSGWAERLAHSVPSLRSHLPGAFPGWGRG